MADKKLYSKEIPLTGKLITSEDPILIGENFQSLKNMRYTNTSIKGIGGHSKINTTILGNPKVRSGVQFQKDDASEVLVQAFDSGLSTSKIYKNTTAIPNTGDFTATEVYSPASEDGRFSKAPNGYIGYCNGSESCIYGSDDCDVNGFINYDPDDSFSRDQYNQISNTINSGAANIATLKRVTNSTADDVLLLHCENNDTDDSPSGHTVNDSNVWYDSTNVFGSYGALLNGTDARFRVPTHADFDFSGADATWTFDGRFRVHSLSAVNPIYWKSTDANNYFGIFVTTTGAIQVSHFASGSETLNSTAGFYSTTGVIAINTWYHIEIGRDGSNWYIFVDGQLKGMMVDTTDIGTETGDVYIGTDGTNYYDGNMDEIRVSSIASHASDFEVSDVAYGDGYATYMYAGSILPLGGIKFYISTANTATSTATVEEWDGSGWSPVTTFVDGTSSGGVSLAQTGIMTFDSTASTSKVKEIKGVLIYWYRVKILSADDSISVYHVTGSVPFQPIVDIWDGMPSTLLSCVRSLSNNEDFTTAVTAKDYIYNQDQTYMDLDSLGTSQSIKIGFSNPQQGIKFHLVQDRVNISYAVISVDYWDGSDWVTVGPVTDKTSNNGKSLNQSGLVSWTKVTDGLEFKKEISDVTNVDQSPTLYYYKVHFDSSLSGTVDVDKITGVPAQTKISNYKFPLHAMDRLWLFSDQDGEKNKSICSAQFTTNTFNGTDSIPVYWGDESEVTGAAWIYSQYGSNVYSVLVGFKKNETWVLIGNNPDTWQTYRISSSIGCVSPETIKVIEVPAQEGSSHSSIIVFQGADGIYMTDGRPPILISQDLNIFDKRKSLITDIENSFSFIDAENQEYHWCFASSAYADTEYVLDYKKMRWFEIERPYPLQYGLEVRTTDGRNYTFGFIDSYMLRLEHGNSFDGTGIEQEWQFGDIALYKGHVTIETSAEYHNLITTTKTTSNDITVTHYGDSSTSGNTFTIAPRKTGFRIVRSAKHKTHRSHLIHSWKFSITTDDETTGFEPLFFSCLFKRERQYIRDYRE